MRNVLIALMLSCGLASAAVGSFESGNILLRQCEQGWQTTEAAARDYARCMAYIGAVIDSHETRLLYFQQPRCVPAEVTLGQAVDVVVKYLKENPAERDLDGSFLVLQAITTAWHCDSAFPTPGPPPAPGRRA